MPQHKTTALATAARYLYYGFIYHYYLFRFSYQEHSCKQVNFESQIIAVCLPLSNLKV